MTKLKELSGLQQKFCQFAGIDILKNGEEFVGFFLDYKNELVNGKAEETKQNLEDTRKKLESAFANDDVLDKNCTAQLECVKSFQTQNIAQRKDKMDKLLKGKVFIPVSYS